MNAVLVKSMQQLLGKSLSAMGIFLLQIGTLVSSIMWAGCQAPKMQLCNVEEWGGAPGHHNLDSGHK